MDLETSEHDLSGFAMPDSPQSLTQLAPPRTPTHLRYTSSSVATFDEYQPSDVILNDSEEEYITEDDIVLPEAAPSGRSSISSFPASVIHHDVRASHDFSRYEPRTPSRSRAGTPTSHYQDDRPLSNFVTRDHISGFRNPSSVRALQMRDEFSDNEDRTPGHRRRGSRQSYISYRTGSAHSTPGKRMSRSLQGSPVKNGSKLRKEFPLVLLHCTLLPSVIHPKAKVVNEELLEAIIPEPYKKRWKLLQEKVLKSFEIRERGVLIAHPKEDYDLLEERLLESLELESPVISNGHYVGRSDSRASAADSGFGSEENSNRGDMTDEEEVEDAKCADCGGHLCGEKRWEVKVYAANGMMRAGAWAAVWSEMEKVDVQISVWLPEDVRLEIEARLDAVIAQEQHLQHGEGPDIDAIIDDERTREIYGGNGISKKQEEIDGLDDPQLTTKSIPELVVPNQHSDAIAQSLSPQPEVDLFHATWKYILLLLQDQRNIVIMLLGIVVAYYATAGQRTIQSNTTANVPAALTSVATSVEYLTTTVFSTSTSFETETSTITTTTDHLAAPFSSALAAIPGKDQLMDGAADELAGLLPTELLASDGESLVQSEGIEPTSPADLGINSPLELPEEAAITYFETSETSSTNPANFEEPELELEL